MQSRQITYAQLEHLLQELGYREFPSSPDARVFAYPEYDAVSILPCAEPSEVIRSHHLITLRKVAVEKGIVDSETFESLISDLYKFELIDFHTAHGELRMHIVFSFDEGAKSAVHTQALRAFGADKVSSQVLGEKLVWKDMNGFTCELDSERYFVYNNRAMRDGHNKLVRQLHK